MISAYKTYGNFFTKTQIPAFSANKKNNSDALSGWLDFLSRTSAEWKFETAKNDESTLSACVKDTSGKNFDFQAKKLFNWREGVSFNLVVKRGEKRVQNYIIRSPKNNGENSSFETNSPFDISHAGMFEYLQNQFEIFK